MRTLIFLSMAIATTLASPVVQDCNTILKQAGVTDRFAGVIAHGTHSLTTQILQQFKPDITEHNSIPTVNMDLKSNQPILSNAPKGAQADTFFKTEAMRTVDQVLSHMDNSQYDIKEYSPLERLVHTLHMKEVWASAGVEYQKFLTTPPSAQVCKCALDVESNGVMTMLRFLALEIREPELMYGKHVKLNNGTATWSGNIYNYSNFVRKTTDAVLRSEKDVIPGLTNEAGWSFWKNLMKTMQPSDDYELALYLYCALN